MKFIPLFFLLACTPPAEDYPWTRATCDETHCRAWWDEGGALVQYLECDRETCRCSWEQAQQECTPGVEVLRVDALIEKVRCCE